MAVTKVLLYMFSVICRNFYGVKDGKYIKMADNPAKVDKVIYNYVPLERNLCIKWQEVKALLNYFDYGHPYRIAFSLLAVTGCRTCELTQIRLDCFNEDYSKVRYPILKNRPRVYNTGTKSFKIRIAERFIPEELSKEIAFYVINNMHLLKDGKLFQFNKDSLRRYLGKLRERARKGLIKDKVLCEALNDVQGVKIIIGEQVNSSYRVTLHSFRRFYETVKHNVDFEKDISRLVRHMGYREHRTALTYLYHPEMVGLKKEHLTNGFSVMKALFKE